MTKTAVIDRHLQVGAMRMYRSVRTGHENESEWSNGTIIFRTDRSDREKRTTSKGGQVFSKLFRFDRTDPLSSGPKFPEILVEWIAPRRSRVSPSSERITLKTSKGLMFINFGNGCKETDMDCNLQTNANYFEV